MIAENQALDEIVTGHLKKARPVYYIKNYIHHQRSQAAVISFFCDVHHFKVSVLNERTKSLLKFHIYEENYILKNCYEFEFHLKRASVGFPYSIKQIFQVFPRDYKREKYM